MNRSNRTGLLTALALTAMCGTSTPVAAREPGAPASVGTADVGRQGDFRSCHWLIGKNINNSEGSQIAEVSDLVLDRGSGLIDYAVLRTGDVLGIGGKTVAVPYNSLRWSGDGESLSLNTTADQLKGYPQFSAEEWTTMMESRKPQRTELYDRFNTPDASQIADPYSEAIRESRTREYKGTIESVDRVRTSGYGEHVVLTIRTDDNTTRKVAIGPSWYVGGSALALGRGDAVEIDAYELPRDQVVAARSIRIGERDLQLRKRDGSPAWSLQGDTSADTKRARTPYWRYALLSTVRGMDVDCRGEACGKVGDVILDRASGQVAFLSIDPDENFLGIADTKRLVPWSVVTISLDGRARIDASKEMVVASPETPTDLTTMRDGARAGLVYRAYQVQQPRFEPARPVNPTPPRTGDAWAPGGPIIGSVERGSTKTIEGEVVEVSEMAFDAGIQPASTITLKTRDGTQRVVLGPAWYMTKQWVPYQKGDSVKAEVCRTNINGKEHWIARSLESKASRVVLWNKDTPVWGER